MAVLCETAQSPGASARELGDQGNWEWLHVALNPIPGLDLSYVTLGKKLLSVVLLCSHRLLTAW